MPLQFDSRRVTLLSIVTVFVRKPNLTLELGRFFSQLAKDVSAEVHFPAVEPSAPDEIPRLVVNGSDVEFSAGLDRFYITFKALSIDVSRDKTSLKQLVANAGKVLERFLAEEIFELRFIGVVGTLNFPQPQETNIRTIQREMAANVIAHMDANRVCENFAYQIGFSHHDEYFSNFRIKAYQTKRLDLKVGEIVRNPIDLDSLEVIEHGIEVNFDINNRPKRKKTAVGSELKGLFAALTDELDSLPQTLSLIEKHPRRNRKDVN